MATRTNQRNRKITRRRRRNVPLVQISAKITGETHGMLLDLVSDQDRISISDAIEKAIRTEYRTWLLNRPLRINDATRRPLG